MPTGAARKRERLVEEHLPFVRALASGLRGELPPSVEFEDLVAYGTQGLLEAAERYDGAHGTSFTTFAYYRVRGAMVDGLRRMGGLPRAEWARARIEDHAAAYLSDLVAREPPPRRRPPSLEEELRDLAGALGGVTTALLTAIEASEAGEGGEAADEAPPPDERLALRRAASGVRAVLPSLPEKERRLIELYYFEERTLEEAGAALGLSKSWTSRLHARAIELLSQALEGGARPAKKRARATSRR
jgi:RNA polymerase sigma factor for flagellar operon FliA